MNPFSQFGSFIQSITPPTLAAWLTTLRLGVFFLAVALIFYSFFSGRITTIFDFPKLFEQLRKTLTPPKWDSWQALIWISVFSWAVSVLAANEVIQGLIASIAWIFLIAGFHWALHEDSTKKLLTFNKLFIGPWLTGALICVYFFGNPGGTTPSIAFVSWPIISATIAVLPKFVVDVGPKYGLPKPSDRQDIVNFFLRNAVLGCWIQLVLATQIWLQAYPELTPAPIARLTQPTQAVPAEAVRSGGAALLDQADREITATLTGQPWSQVERWLIDLDRNLTVIDDRARLRIPSGYRVPWRLQGQILPGQEYLVQLLALPSSSPEAAYTLSKTCRITRSLIFQPRVGTQPESSGDRAASVRCGPVEAQTT